MTDPFTGEPDPLDVEVAARVIRRERDGTLLSATLTDGTDAAGGEVMLHVSDSAESVHGLHACVEEFELFVNTVFSRNVRLGGALAMGTADEFKIGNRETGPYVVRPTMPTDADLAA